MSPMDRLRYHVSDAIERGEKKAIEAIPRHIPYSVIVNNKLVHTIYLPPGMTREELIKLIVIAP